jgi:hypothetical protein
MLDFMVSIFLSGYDGKTVQYQLNLRGKRDCAHVLTRRYIASTVPVETCGYSKCNGLIVLGKIKRERSDEGKTVSGIRHI